MATIAKKAGLILVASVLALACFGCSSGGEEKSAEPAVEPKTEVEQEPEKEEAAEKADPDAEALAAGKTVKYIDQYYTNLKDAVDKANQNGGGTVVLLADTVDTENGESPTIGFRTSITIKSGDGGPFKVYRADGQANEMLRITDGTITVKDVVFDGSGEGVTSPIVMISDLARVTFGSGLVLTGNASDGSGYAENFGASAVSISGPDAYVTIESGCMISDCTGSGLAKAALYNDGANVANSGGSFSGNTSETDTPNYAGTGTYEGDPIA
ncbi:hypothetical protein [Raoultibacter massiliensis]|uniref:Uncharacterized protein n=1 Tax=Raoultibacter massiliensis TaxID=1852371 RepID=A0ABV1J8R3_9ACTN|nr:hypothetical protein [Raoultibacter massiliensis]